MKPGPKPRGRISTLWSPQLAYAIGLITADGCLYKDGRHLSLTSKDMSQIEAFKDCLGLKTKVSLKLSGSGGSAYHTQFGDVLFYKFLNSIGITSAKSKTIGEVQVPDEYFFAFFRGYFDGDGCSISYYDPIYPKSFRFYIAFTSASPKYFEWLRTSVQRLAKIKGFFG